MNSVWEMHAYPTHTQERGVAHHLRPAHRCWVVSMTSSEFEFCCIILSCPVLKKKSSSCMELPNLRVVEYKVRNFHFIGPEPVRVAQ